MIYVELMNASTDIISNACIVTGSWREKSRKMNSETKSCIKCPKRKDVQLAEEKQLLLKSHIFKISTKNTLNSMIKHIEKRHFWQETWEDTGALKSSELENSWCQDWQKSPKEWKILYLITNSISSQTFKNAFKFPYYQDWLTPTWDDRSFLYFKYKVNN